MATRPRTLELAPFALVAVLASCAAEPAACPKAPPAIAMTPTPATVSGEAPAERDSVAVLPIHDSELFRAERADLRARLRERLVALASDYDFVPIAEIDTKSKPVSKSSGARCAHESEDAARLLDTTGWLTTAVWTDVPTEKGKPAEIDVEINDRTSSHAATFVAPWAQRGAPVERYLGAFGALQRLPAARSLLGMYGELMGSGEVKEGALTFCEGGQLGDCAPTSSAWKDSATTLAACFKDDDEGDETFVVDASGGASRCEVADLEDTGGHRGELERCACKALVASQALKANPARRNVRVKYEAPALVGRPRPEMRIVEASSNAGATEDWHTVHESPTKGDTRTIRRLTAGNLDVLAARASACTLPPGQIVIADVVVSDAGAVTAFHVISGADKAATRECVEKAIAKGAFPCTDDGKGASLKIALLWPNAAH